MNMNSCSCNHMKVRCSPQDVDELGKLLRLVGDEKRLQVLVALQDGGEHCVCEFEEHMKGVSQSLLSHHLADLRQAGLIAGEKKGLRVYYRLTEYGRRVMRGVCKLIEEKEQGS